MAAENASKFEKLLREDEALRAKMEAAFKAFEGDTSDEKAVFDATVAPLAWCQTTGGWPCIERGSERASSSKTGSDSGTGSLVRMVR